MIVAQQTLETLLLSNVLDLRFTRRIPVAGKPVTRRMLCTKSYELLNSTNGRIVLNYLPPKRGKQINEAITNTCVVWDILMQDWRMVNLNSCDIVKTIKRNEFWEYFNKTLMTMSPQEKITYMNV